MHQTRYHKYCMWDKLLALFGLISLLIIVRVHSCVHRYIIWICRPVVVNRPARIFTFTITWLGGVIILASPIVIIRSTTKRLLTANWSQWTIIKRLLSANRLWCVLTVKWLVTLDWTRRIYRLITGGWCGPLTACAISLQGIRSTMIVYMIIVAYWVTMHAAFWWVFIHTSIILSVFHQYNYYYDYEYYNNRYDHCYRYHPWLCRLNYKKNNT